MSFLQQLEASLASLADSALINVHPTGGFAGFLQRSPSFAAIFVLAVTSAHNALVKMEINAQPQAAKPADVAVVPR